MAETSSTALSVRAKEAAKVVRLGVREHFFSVGLLTNTFALDFGELQRAS
jgi:hypothetical protein